MQIWVDADACPNLIKDILFRAANRTHTQLILVSNHAIGCPPSPYIKKMQVVSGFDVADDKIVQSVQAGDLVITADIPLAEAVVSKGCIALNPRGELYSTHNIKQRLSLRNFSEELRSTGMMRGGGPPKISSREVQAFANYLDQFLARH